MVLLNILRRMVSVILSMRKKGGEKMFKDPGGGGLGIEDPGQGGPGGWK
jgi:hypothetical protein